MTRSSQRPPTEKRPPAAPARRYVAAVVVTALGVTLSLLAWMRSLEERRFGISNVLASLADEASSAIELQLEHQVNAVRDLAASWNLHGPADDESWLLLARRTMKSNPGIQWIEWVQADPPRTHRVARDPSAQVEPRVQRWIRAHLRSATGDVQERWSDTYDVDVLAPVGPPGGRGGILAASIRVDSLWLRGVAPTSQSLAIHLTSEQGRQLVLRRPATDHVPPAMKLRRAFTSPSGHKVQIDLVQRREFALQVGTPWPHYFLTAGVLLSLFGGILLFQYLRTQDYSAMLARANRDLDAQLAELSRRDRELRELNEALEQRVEERTVELSDALHDVETFSHSVAHDLRSPLGAILNYAVALEESRSNLSDEDRRIIHRMRDAAQRSCHLLSGLLEFGSSGASPLQPQVVDVRAVVEGACAEVAAGEPERQSVKFEIDRLPSAYADPLQVHRIFVNLLGNALKYSRGRPLRAIQVGGAAGASHATFWVKDNGPGIEPSLVPEIFKPFRRLGGANVDGAGLGLAIVAGIVRRQGGRVWAESDGTNGAAFYFTLPGVESREDGGPSKTARDRRDLDRVRWAPGVVG
jgi:signal transduction histidine kinase